MWKGRMFYRPLRSCEGNTRVNLTEIDMREYGVDSSGSEEGSWQAFWTQINNKDLRSDVLHQRTFKSSGMLRQCQQVNGQRRFGRPHCPHLQVQAVQVTICFKVMSLNSVLHVCGSCLLAETGVTADPTNRSILPPLSASLSATSQAPDAICSPPSHRSILSHSLHSQAMSAVMRKTSITLPDIGDEAYKIAEGCAGNQTLSVNTECVIQSQILDLVLNSWCHWNPPFLTDVSPVTFPELLKNQSWLGSILITKLWQLKNRTIFHCFTVHFSSLNLITN